MLKMKQLTVACAIAATSLAGTATQAFALGAFDAADTTVYLTGASAQDNNLEAVLTSMFVGVKGTDWFKYTDNGTGNDFRAYFGTVKSTADIPVALRAKKVLLIKRSKGGSIWGVNAVARNESIATLKIDAGSCTLTAGDYKCPAVGTDPGVGAPTGQEMKPDFGISDVAPNLFKGPYNVEFGFNQLSTTEVATLTVKPINVLTMGLAVTNVIPDSTFISRAVYGSLLSAGITDWSTVDAALAPPAGTNVVVCRRVPGSGTQSSYNWYFNNFPCTNQSTAGSGDIAPAGMGDSAGYQVSGTGTPADPYVIDPTAGYTVLENGASGDVRNCLAKAAAGGIHTFKDGQGKSYKVDFGTGGYGAIGVLSADSLESTGNGANQWSFRAIDGAGKMYDSNPAANAVTVVTTGTGVHPTKANLIEGKYEFAAEATMQYRTALTGLKKTVADEVIERLKDPAFNTREWVAALPPTFDPTTTANVTKGTRSGNMCKPLLRSF